jgi:hypothetical protein
MQLSDKALYGCEQVSGEIGISGCQIVHAAQCALRHDQDMHGIGRLRVMKGQQCIGLSQTIDGDDKTHVREHPSNHITGKTRPRQPEQQDAQGRNHG